MKLTAIVLGAVMAGVAFYPLEHAASAQGRTQDRRQQDAPAPAHPSVSANGDLVIPSTTVPFSAFGSPAAQQAFVRKLTTPGPALGSDILAQRAFWNKYNDSLAARMKELYAVDINAETFDKVRTEVITPKQGVSPQNQQRILINLHGGAFLWGEGSGGEVESIPIASVGKIKVITVAYREGPENRFPAASEDVATVYAGLLKQYEPANIGIYGCSAGGILTGEAVAWFEHVKLPMPGAIGTFCGSVDKPSGDSSYVARLLTGESLDTANAPLTSLPYFQGADPNDPLVFPISSTELLKKFPPTLLITGSRDFMASSLYHAQSVLSGLGVENELHVWDGMWHAFFVDPDLPESREVYTVVAKFFDRHLGAHDRTVQR